MRQKGNPPMDWINIIGSVGFPIVLVLLGVNLFAKHIPTILSEWRRFTIANESFAKTVERNTEITYKSYGESTNVKELLEKALEKLETHHHNATEIRDDVWEVRSILTELMQQLEEMRDGE